MLVFDLFDRTSFTNLDNWLQEVDNHAKPSIQIIVIANKADLVSQSNEEGQNEEFKRQVSEEDI